MKNNDADVREKVTCFPWLSAVETTSLTCVDTFVLGWSYLLLNQAYQCLSIPTDIRSPWSQANVPCNLRIFVLKEPRLDLVLSECQAWLFSAMALFSFSLEEKPFNNHMTCRNQPVMLLMHGDKRYHLLICIPQASIKGTVTAAA